METTAEGLRAELRLLLESGDLAAAIEVQARLDAIESAGAQPFRMTLWPSRKCRQVALR